jgi:AraC family transcriptional regulator, exoenzyme S synthesis regulatory protein ExsA
MVNLYSFIKESNLYPKMEVSELLFVEYTCMQEENKFGIWSNNNYFAFISSGKKIWKTIHHSYDANDGDILFVKKGANLTHQFFGEKFCAIFIFIPDEFIREFMNRNIALAQDAQKDVAHQDAVLRVQSDELLKSYYHSIHSYLSLSVKPSKQLLILKFEELLLSLFSNEIHQDLTDYFLSLSRDQEYQMRQVMEQNFAYNLTLENYAQLCHMSLSSFKKSFKAYYKATPGAWLQQRKLDHATHLVLHTNLSINQISIDCGFEDTSHFIRLFKQRHRLTPLQFRQQHMKIGSGSN